VARALLAKSIPERIEFAKQVRNESKESQKAKKAKATKLWM
jgi:hypothetical protein